MKTLIPTMNDWWELTRKYPAFRARRDKSILKDFGYMAIMDVLDQNSKLQRVLEFGHGDSTLLLERYHGIREMWGVDKFQGLTYYPDVDKWDRAQKKIADALPKVRLCNALLGKPGPDFPQSYFDVVCSVSVLEELPLEDILAISRHAHSLLRTGGLFLNTHDLILGQWDRLSQFLELQRQAGFEVSDLDPMTLETNQLVLENPIIAMAGYQHADGEDRKFWGHWTTVFTVLKKL